jgi:DNA-binding FadR family transcriptional regulator
MAELLERGAFWRVPKRQRVLDGKEVAREDEQFHRTLVQLAGNREMLRTFDNLTERIRIIRRLGFHQSGAHCRRVRRTRKNLEMLLARKADSAEMLIKAHINASRTEIRHITLHRLALAAPGTAATQADRTQRSPADGTLQSRVDIAGRVPRSGLAQ